MANEPVEGADAIVSALYRAYNAHDAGAAAALYAPDGRHVERATGQQSVGADAIGGGLGGLLAAFPDARWHERTRIVAGERAAVTYVLEGTLQAPFGPFEPAGQHLQLHGVHVLDVGPAGIRLCEDFWDAASFGRQMRPA
ncbi:MAG: hypothetical protein JWN65_817 [Solirubrobacterales bacterium]|nr:hypothetical protein [Solirubrobacterales bacterium]